MGFHLDHYTFFLYPFTSFTDICIIRWWVIRWWVILIDETRQASQDAASILHMALSISHFHPVFYFITPMYVVHLFLWHVKIWFSYYGPVHVQFWFLISMLCSTCQRIITFYVLTNWYGSSLPMYINVSLPFTFVLLPASFKVPKHFISFRNQVIKALKACHITLSKM